MLRMFKRMALIATRWSKATFVKLFPANLFQGKPQESEFLIDAINTIKVNWFPEHKAG